MFKNQNVVALALSYQPILLFDPSERFYPIAAEEFLNHRSTEPWNPNTNERGSAVMLTDCNATSFDDVNVLAGSHFPAGDHLELSDSAPNGIGQLFSVNSSSQDLFLNVAGWDDAQSSSDPKDPRFTKGSLEYLDLLFRRVSNAMNPSIPLEETTPTPKFTIPRLKVPTVYAEVEWAGIYPRLDKERVDQVGGQRDFAPAIGNGAPSEDTTMHEFDSYIAVNYYLLYPAMEPALARDTDEIRKREGQWEAITVFLKSRDLGDRLKMRNSRDGRQRPDFFFSSDVPGYGDDGMVHVPGTTDFFEPRFVAYSQGYGNGADIDSPLSAEVRFVTPDSFFFNRSPLVYVSAGLHKNLFDIAAQVTTGDSPPDPTLNTVGGAMMGFGGSAFGVCISITTICPAGGPLTVAGCVACWGGAAAIFLIGLILFILSYFFKSDPPVTEAPNPSSTDLARDGGGQALPAGYGTLKKPGVSPVGRSVSAQIRVIDRFGFDPTPPITSYPLPSTTTPENPIVEMPTWWDFTGRWGVRVVHRATSEWDNGTRRVDNFGRSRGYWNTYNLMKFIADSERSNDGIGL